LNGEFDPGILGADVARLRERDFLDRVEVVVTSR